MNTDTLLSRMAEKSGQSPKAVQAILAAFPDVLMELELGEKVHTPLGTFEKKRRKAKRMTSVNSGAELTSRAKEVVTLRAGDNLKVALTDLVLHD